MKVESITVSASSNTITEQNGTLQMAATVLPENATDKSVTWSVTVEDGSATELASIDENGLLTAAETEGAVKVTATANDGSGVTGEMLITIDFAAEPVETYTITVTAEGEGEASANLTEAAEGTQITLSQTAAEGWHFVEWKSEDVTV